MTRMMNSVDQDVVCGQAFVRQPWLCMKIKSIWVVQTSPNFYRVVLPAAEESPVVVYSDVVDVIGVTSQNCHCRTIGIEDANGTVR